MQGVMLSADFDQWVSRLAQLETPVLQATLEKLSVLQKVPDISAARIAAAVLTDPMMTFKLMRLANASKAGVFAQRIATAEHAVMMLGIEPVLKRLGETCALEVTLPPIAQQGLLRTATRAYHAALQAREWAVHRLDTNVEEVYIAALLQELGEMACWQAAPEQMAAVDKMCRKTPRDEVEQGIFGFSLQGMSMALAEQWNMPPLVNAAMQPEQCESHVRPRCVMLANRLAIHAEWGWYDSSLSSDFEAIAQARRMSVDDVVVQAHRTAVEAARRQVLGSVPPAATWLPMLPGDWPPDSEEPSAAIQAISSRIEPADPFQQAMEGIVRLRDGAAPTLQELMVLIMRGMRDGVGLERVVFALLSKDRGTLAAKSVIGAEAESPLKKFRFNMAERHLFSILMAKPQAIYLTAENRAKYAAYLTDEIVTTTSGRDFYAMSISLNGKVIGLFYGDGGVLDVSRYEKFKKLCTQAAQGMAGLADKKS